MKHTHTHRDTAACSHTLAKFTKKRLAGKQSITGPLPLIEGRTDNHAHAYASFLLILSHAYTVTTNCFKLRKFSLGEALFFFAVADDPEANGTAALSLHQTVVLPAERNADRHVMKYASPSPCH